MEPLLKTPQVEETSKLIYKDKLKILGPTDPHQYIFISWKVKPLYCK